jgi:hypothetical protein
LREKNIPSASAIAAIGRVPGQKSRCKIFFEKGKEFEGNDVLNLNSCWRDPAFIREQLAYHVYAACGVPCSKTRMVRLRVNGEFYGLFSKSRTAGQIIFETVEPERRRDLQSQLDFATLGSRATSGTNRSFRGNYEKETRKDEDFRDLQSFCHELATTKDIPEFFHKQSI